MRAELKKIFDANVFSEAAELDDIKKLHPDAHLTKLMGILGIKHAEMEAALQVFKARFVLRGDDIRAVDNEAATFGEVSNCPTTMSVIKHVVAYSVLTGFKPSQADCISAYIQHFLKPEDGPPTYVTFSKAELTPLILEFWPDLAKLQKPCLRLLKPLYGHPKAGYLFEKWLHGVLLNLGWKHLGIPQTYIKHQPGSPHSTVLTAYVDDLTMGGANQDAEWALLRKHLDTTAPVELKEILGVHVQTVLNPTDQLSSVFFEMIDYTKTAISRYTSAKGSLPIKSSELPFVEPSHEQLNDVNLAVPGDLKDVCASLVMTLMFLARMVRADILFAVCRISQFLSRWTKLQDLQLNKLFGYLSLTLDTGLRFLLPLGGNAISKVKLVGYPDADHGGCPHTARSTGGAAVSVVAGDGSLCFPEFQSKRQGSVSHSTTEAEITSCDNLVHSFVIPAELLWTEFLQRPVEVLVREDNQASCRVIATGYSAQLRYMLKTQRVNLAFLGEYFHNPMHSLEYVSTKDQCADFLTKALDTKFAVSHARNLVGLISKPKSIK